MIEREQRLVIESFQRNQVADTPEVQIFPQGVDFISVVTLGWFG